MAADALCRSSCEHAKNKLGNGFRFNSVLFNFGLVHPRLACFASATSSSERRNQG